MKNYVTYYRVSTKKQDFGLDAQKLLVSEYISRNPGNIIGEFEEKEHGDNNERVELSKAIDMVKLMTKQEVKDGLGDKNTVLIIAKLDRLSRDVHFISGLTKNDINFICCDNPLANKLTLHILAAVAENELDMIRKRTKEGLAAKVAREKYKKDENGNLIRDENGNLIETGFKLGNPYKGGEIKKDGTIAKKPFGNNRDSVKSFYKEKMLKNENYQRNKKMAEDLKSRGMNCLKIRDYFNEYGFKTTRGFNYDISAVSKLLRSEESQFKNRPTFKDKELSEVVVGKMG